MWLMSKMAPKRQKLPKENKPLTCFFDLSLEFRLNGRTCWRVPNDSLVGGGGHISLPSFFFTLSSADCILSPSVSSWVGYEPNRNQCNYCLQLFYLVIFIVGLVKEDVFRPSIQASEALFKVANLKTWFFWSLLLLARGKSEEKMRMSWEAQTRWNFLRSVGRYLLDFASRTSINMLTRMPFYNEFTTLPESLGRPWSKWSPKAFNNFSGIYSWEYLFVKEV